MRTTSTTCSENRRTTTRGRTRWFAAIATALVLLVHAANVPFYAGSSLGREHSWRMEHGRLTVKRSASTSPQAFWVAPNAEGLRWAGEWRRFGPGEWTVTLPLWAPLGLGLLWCAASWRRRPPRAGRG